MIINKEYGSDFNLTLEPKSETNFLIENPNINLFFSGRAAIYCLLEWGIKNKGWNKVFIPSYYCHEVVQFIKLLNIQIEYYNYNPFSESGLSADLEGFDIVGNVFINVDFFGVKKIPCSGFQNATLVEDLTHNIQELENSQADYCFGSLRKILPIPCGGFLSSPRGSEIPKGIASEFAERISQQKLTAMYLKTEYLIGKNSDKELFRNLFVDAEEQFSNELTFAELPLSSLSVLKYLDTDAIFKKKKDNLSLILDRLEHFQGLKYNLSEINENALGLIIQLDDSKKRDSLRSYLISNKIFPAVLWPDQYRVEDIATSKSILFLHIDFRYDSEDMIYLADTLNSFFRDDTTN